MRIAQIAPLAESVPPKLYGGTERVVSWLTDELVDLGHDVTLFASGDSRTSSLLKNLKSNVFGFRFSSSCKGSVRFGSECSRLVATLSL
jgi:hypothetical protein